MKSIRTLCIIAIGMGLLCGCATLGVREPEVRAVHPRITGIDFTGITMAFDVDVYNPNVFAIRAPRLRYALDVEGSRLFGSETTSPINLPKNKTGMLSFPVYISYLDLIQTYQALAHAPEAHYNLTGGLLFPVVGRTLELPFSHEGTFPILRPPTFSDVSVHLGEVSPAGTRIDINALAKNPNVFSLGIENLGYTLKLGDLQIADVSATAGQTLGAGQTAPVHLSAEASTASTVLGFLGGSRLGEAKLVPSGSIQTPYGQVMLR